MTAALFISVAGLIARECTVSASRLTAETTLEALAIDSLDRVALAVAVEETFRVTIPDGEEQEWETVGDICRWLASAGVAA